MKKEMKKKPQNEKETTKRTIFQNLDIILDYIF